MNSIIVTVAKALQRVVNEKADELAKQTGFIHRVRKITGSNFVKTLVFCFLQNFTPSVEGIVRSGVSHKLEISAQGFHKRFNEEAAELMKEVLNEALKQMIEAQNKVAIDVLNRFTKVYLSDCTVINLDDSLHKLWAGTGGTGNTSKAALKIDTCLELQTGQLQCGLLPGKHSDNRSPLANAEFETGCLRVQDLGYFNLERMKAQADRGEYWLSRYQINTSVFDLHGEKINLVDFLFKLKQAGVYQYECEVVLGVNSQLKARLLLWRLPEEASGRARAKMKENAANQGRVPKKENLALCDWKILLTNATPELLEFKDCFLLYSVRWQIELLFKLWKSHGKLAISNSENPWRNLCELYAKFLALIIQHWLVLTGFWHVPERSLVKAGQLIREQSSRLAVCMNNLDALVSFLIDLSHRFNIGCRMNKRKKHPNTYQQLIDGYEFS